MSPILRILKQDLVIHLHHTLHLKKSKAKYNILVVRVNHLEKLVDSKPCIMCIHAMKENGINKVFFSTEDGNIECMKVNEMEPEHVSYGAIASMKRMTKLNQYLISLQDQLLNCYLLYQLNGLMLILRFLDFQVLRVIRLHLSRASGLWLVRLHARRNQSAELSNEIPY